MLQLGVIKEQSLESRIHTVQNERLTGMAEGVMNMLPVIDLFSRKRAGKRIRDLLELFRFGIASCQLCNQCLLPVAEKGKTVCRSCADYIIARKQNDLQKRFRDELRAIASYSGMSQKENTVVFLLSGGLDSITALSILIRHFPCRVVAVTINHSWMKPAALRFSQRFCRKHQIMHLVIPADSKGQFLWKYHAGCDDDAILRFPWCSYCVGWDSDNFPLIETIAHTYGAKAIILGSNLYSSYGKAGKKVSGRASVLKKMGLDRFSQGPSLISVSSSSGSPIPYFSLNPAFQMTNRKRGTLLGVVNHPLRRIIHKESDCDLYPSFDAAIVGAKTSNALMHRGGVFSLTSSDGIVHRISVPGSGAYFEFQSGFLDAVEYLDILLQSNAYTAKQRKQAMVYLRRKLFRNRSTSKNNKLVPRA